MHTPSPFVAGAWKWNYQLHATRTLLLSYCYNVIMFYSSPVIVDKTM